MVDLFRLSDVAYEPHFATPRPTMRRRARATLRAACVACVLSATVVAASTMRADARRAARRGVDPMAIASYDVETFRCDDGATTLAIARVNDDYCDCADGSDEPGTSACAGRGLGRDSFYCRNLGATPRAVPSSRVDDGVCDCCDGSDEAHGRKGTVCENTCTSEARARRETLMATLAEHRRGAKARGKAAGKANGKREGWIRERAALEREMSGKRERVEALRVEAEAAEEEERKIREEKEAEEAEAKEKIAADAVKAEDAENDAGAAERDVENSNVDEPEAPAEETDEERGKRIASQWISNDEKSADDSSASEEEKVAAEGAVESDDFMRPPRKVGSFFKRLRDVVRRPRDAVLASQAKSKRDAYDVERRALEANDDKLRELRENIDRDYGPDDALISLQGLCFDQKIEKYVYKACPFGEAKQDNTQLGRNSEGVRIDADGKTMTLKFADGDACWNGPKRSLTLTLKCGDKERLAAIEEPSRCEYVGVFYAPAACDDASVFALERELSDLDRILAASSISPRDEL